MLVTPSFDEIQDQVTPGQYTCIVKKGEVKEWPNGGQYINWELETVGEAVPKNNGRRIFHKTSLSGKGAFMLQQFYLAAVGQPLTGQFDTEQLAGKKVAVEIVDGVNRASGEPTGYPEVKKVKRVSV
jgi:hypothetical protein